MNATPPSRLLKLLSLTRRLFLIAIAQAAFVGAAYLRPQCTSQFNATETLIHGIEASCMELGETMVFGECLRAGRFLIGFAQTGELVEGIARVGNPVIWTNNRPSGSELTLLENSILSIMSDTADGGETIWSANKQGKSASQFCLLQDGTFGLYDDERNVWKPKSASCGARVAISKKNWEGLKVQCLQRGGLIRTCQSMYAGDYRVTMQGRYAMKLIEGATGVLSNIVPLDMLSDDGNFVLYRMSDDQPQWDTASPGTYGKYFVYQYDGNVVLYDNTGASLWSTDTSKVPSTDLCIQPDGNFVLYDRKTPVWDSGTMEL
ncbi:hypothetical protein HDU77_009776 [Chytriomyces hyalinus]|nr:hypothetical protein HDU77_009776 [Chytriomyces hyalinus]